MTAGLRRPGCAGTAGEKRTAAIGGTSRDADSILASGCVVLGGDPSLVTCVDDGLKWTYRMRPVTKQSSANPVVDNTAEYFGVDARYDERCAALALPPCPQFGRCCQLSY